VSEVDAMAFAIERANANIVEAVQRTGHTVGWLRPVGAADRRSAATLAHHIGTGYQQALDWGESVRTRRLMPEITRDSIAAANAEEAVEFSAPTPESVLEWLESTCAELLVFVRSLADADLSVASTNVVMGSTWTVHDVLDSVISHTERHADEFVAATRA
jgi:hypothetical protein